ncbi:MAG: DUF4212 domain-containing protein [Rhodocyclaceae bacterium]|nr:DUF4212 domain-containing protein [Rhodocyclaceae bacterium]
MPPSPRQREYWRANLLLTGSLLAVWALVTFVPVYFARELNTLTFFGWPLAFYMGAQGSLIVYVVVIGVYALAMNRIERKFGLGEPD